MNLPGIELDILKAMCELGISTTKGKYAIHIIGVLFGWYSNNSKECNHNEIWKNIQKMAADKNPLITMTRIKNEWNEEDLEYPMDFECKLTALGKSFVIDNNIGDDNE